MVKRNKSLGKKEHRVKRKQKVWVSLLKGCGRKAVHRG